MSRAELQFYETIIRELPKVRKILDEMLTELKNNNKLKNK